MTNVFGSGAPQVDAIDESDTGPLQLGHAFSAATPCVVTHIRYYVATATMAANTAGSLPFYVWREGEPDSTVTGSLTIPASVGWVTTELSPHLFVPADRRFGAAVALPSGTQSYGAGFQALPESNKLLTVEGGTFLYDSGPLNPYAFGGLLGTSYLIDVEVAVSEMVHLAPASMADGDTLQIERVISGVVNTGGITPVTDAYTVNLHVTGGPLDGTDVDVWVPDTENGLASAAMVLLKELPDPDVGSLWQASDGSLWVYQGGAVYDCFAPGTTFPEGSKTSRAATPSLTTWSP